MGEVGRRQGALYSYFSCKSPIIPLPLQAFLPLTHPSTVSFLGILEAQEDGGGDGGKWVVLDGISAHAYTYWLAAQFPGRDLAKPQLWGICMLWEARQLQLEPLATLS